MTEWVKLGDRLPDIPSTRDYITVTIKLSNNQTIIVQYTKRWGWRDANFTKLDGIIGIIEWDKDSIK